MEPNNTSTTRPGFVVATGRFQSPIHQGHIEYLGAARRHAGDVGAPFVILTGPLDEERRATEPLCFAERRVLLSLIVGLPERYILNQGGTPHGDYQATMDWAEGFFAPIRPEGRLHPTATLIQLGVVRKESDIKSYSVGGEACHYSDLLASYYPRESLEIIDLTDEVTRLDLSSSRLRVDIESHEDVLPPIVFAAHLLKQEWPSVPPSAWSPVLGAVRDALGSSPGVPAEVVRQVLRSRPEFMKFV